MPTHIDAPAGRLTVNVGIATTRLLSADPERRSILINPPAAGRLWFFPDENLSAREGFSLNWDGDPLALCCCSVGRLIGATWYAIIEAGDGPVTDRWNEQDTQLAGIAEATHAAVADRRHRVTGAVASYDQTAQFGDLDIQVNAVGVSEIHFTYNTRGHGYGGHIEGASNQAVSAELSAGAGGINNFVSLWGVTVDAGDAGANVGIIESAVDPHERF